MLDLGIGLKAKILALALKLKSLALALHLVALLRSLVAASPLLYLLPCRS